MEKLNALSESEHHVLRELRRRLEEKFSCISFEMILFGSKARGDADEHSDLDVAIIVEGMDRSLKNKILDTVADIEFEYLQPVSALVLFSQEFERLRARERRIAYDIEHEGTLV